MADKAAGAGGEKRPPGNQPGEVLHQRRKLPFCPLRLSIGGALVGFTLGYFVLYSKKKPEATAVDVAKVATGVATPRHTHPSK
ncbi:hypothetical protein RND81_03G229500 [Saponaria officinalis]|uniref:Uncharacterized protein n=1 Tax=Saponaria officinalis TaxID=3572 RepID=A0AAW1M9K6_SAPOF